MKSRSGGSELQDAFEKWKRAQRLVGGDEVAVCHDIREVAFDAGAAHAREAVCAEIERRLEVANEAGNCGGDDRYLSGIQQALAIVREAAKGETND